MAAVIYRWFVVTSDKPSRRRSRDPPLDASLDAHTTHPRRVLSFKKKIKDCSAGVASADDEVGAARDRTQQQQHSKAGLQMYRRIGSSSR